MNPPCQTCFDAPRVLWSVDAITQAFLSPHGCHLPAGHLPDGLGTGSLPEGACPERERHRVLWRPPEGVGARCRGQRRLATPWQYHLKTSLRIFNPILPKRDAWVDASEMDHYHVASRGSGNVALQLHGTGSHPSPWEHSRCKCVYTDGSTVTKSETVTRARCVSRPIHHFFFKLRRKRGVMNCASTCSTHGLELVLSGWTDTIGGAAIAGATQTSRLLLGARRTHQDNVEPACNHRCIPAMPHSTPFCSPCHRTARLPAARRWRHPPCPDPGAQRLGPPVPAPSSRPSVNRGKWRMAKVTRGPEGKRT